jgi:class 3 adenylate cyclase
MKVRLIRKGFVSLLFIIVTSLAYSQEHSTDTLGSLLLQLKSVTNDSLRTELQIDMSRVYANRKDYHTAIDYLRQVIPYLKRKGDVERERQVKVYHNIAACYTSLLQPNDAVTYLEKAKEIAPEGSQTLPKVYAALISAENNRGNMANALNYSQMLLKLGEKRSDKRIVAIAYYYIGYCYHANGNFEKAKDNYVNSLANYEAIGDTIMIASLQINMGEYYMNNNDLKAASLYLNRALKTFTAANDKAKMAALYERLGGIYYVQNNYDEMMRLSEKSIELAREMNDKKLLSFYNFQNEVYKLVKMFGSFDTLTTTHIVTADQKKELQEIVRNMTANIDVYRRETVNHKELSRMYLSLTNAQVLNKEFEGALVSYSKYVAYKDSFASAENMHQFATIDARFSFERSRDSLKLAEEQKRLLLQKEIALNALKFEYEKKRALAKTEEERKRLLLEEQFKREAIEKDYARNRDLNEASYQQSLALAKAEKDKQAIVSRAEISRLNYVRNLSLAGAGILLVFASGAIWAYAQKRKDNRKIALEKERSDELLLNILPAEVAQELKAEGHSEARRYNDTTVLFTDFVNFTTFSEQSEPEELLNELNICFTAFDKILEQYGLEKIKTIGDAYLAVSGLPKPDTRHATQAVYAALDILTFIKQRKKEHTSGFDIRIGINSGPLIAGIVGVKKFAYDIWGDTVNTASRMESSGSPGKINISQTTFELVHNEFRCTHRGKINAKNKGDIDMYFVDEIIN